MCISKRISYVAVLPFCLICLVFLLALIPAYSRDNRIVEILPVTDTNHNKIHDVLENKLNSGTARMVSKNGKNFLDLIVCFDRSPDSMDSKSAISQGGEVKTTWSNALYGMHILIPPDKLTSYINHNSHIIFVEENSELHFHLEYSTRQMKARDVWAGSGLPSGYSGNSTHKIAILDTGLDSSHSDLDMAAWVDFVTSNPAPSSGWDGNGHGTHVAGIATGKGTAGGLTDYSISISKNFSSTLSTGSLMYYPVMVGGTPKTITGRLKWFSGGTSFLELRNNIPTSLGFTQGVSPVITVSSPISNVTSFSYQALPGAFTNPPAGTFYGAQVDVPFDAWGDGFNLLRGVAPNTRSVGLRVLDDSGSGNSSDYISACDWLVSSCAFYGIVAGNASLGASYQDLGGRFAPEEVATNNVVNAGCMMALSAGNDQSISENIGDPAYSAYAITVAAVSNTNQITNYSSLGVATETIIKPDVSAPGGSGVTRQGITSADSNDVDSSTTDQFANDYTTLQGTSMASPHVAGLIGLIADAKGSWNFGSSADPFFAKNIILMTAWESQGGELAVPPLNRGGKDLTEGYGRVNADACIEAVTLTYNMGSTEGAFLGSDDTSKKVWARKIQMTSSVITVSMTNPGGADFDLYLYRSLPGTNGEPVILASSVTAATGGTEQISYSNISPQSAYLVVKQVNGSGTFSLVAGNAPPIASSIPSLKLFTNQSLNSAFDLKNFNTGGDATSFTNPVSFLSASSLSGSTVNESSYTSATSGSNTYALANTFGVNSVNNKVKYSSYKIYKLPKVGLVTGNSWDINIASYTYSSTGNVIPASYGNPTAIVLADPSKVTATWVGNTIIRITAGTSYSGAVNVDVIASPNAVAPFGSDIDKERIQVYSNLLANGTFNIGADTASYSYQVPAGFTNAPGISYFSSMTDASGTVANGVVGFSFNDNTYGFKITPMASNWLSYTNGQWYTARARVFSPDAGNLHQFQLFNYGGQAGIGHVDIATNIYFGTPTTWSWIDTPLYVRQTTNAGYPQLFIKAAAAGSMFLDELQIINSAPSLADAGRGFTRLKYSYGLFTNQSDATSGFSIQQLGGVNGIPSLVDSDGTLTADFTLANAGNLLGTKMTAINGGVSIYTPAVVIGREVGVRATVRVISGTFSTLNSLILAACYGVSSNGANDYLTGGQVLAVAEFSGLTGSPSAPYRAIGNAKNGFYQFQFQVKNDNAGFLNIDNIDFDVDADDPNFGDQVLFP